MVRFRLEGEENAVRSTLTTIRDVADVDSIEEIDDQGRHLRDDSSSAGMAKEFVGGLHDIEVHAMTDHAASKLRDRVEHAARAHGIALEFVERF